MRFLFAAKHPPAGGVAFGGVASWIVTIQKQLELRGHDCAAWGPSDAEPWDDFDIGVIANYRAVSKAEKWCERVVNVSHGVVIDESPGGSANVVCTSEEVRDFWRCNGPILRQPIDLDFWRDEFADRFDLVFYSYRAKSALGFDHLAQRLGLNFVWLKDVDALAARDRLQKAKLVFASGRAALEALACGAPTIIADERDYNGGPLLCFDLEKAMARNYSGRGGTDPRDVDLDALAVQTMAFQKPRAYVEARHDARVIADELLALC